MIEGAVWRLGRALCYYYREKIENAYQVTNVNILDLSKFGRHKKMLEEPQTLMRRWRELGGLFKREMGVEPWIAPCGYGNNKTNYHLHSKFKDWLIENFSWYYLVFSKGGLLNPFCVIWKKPGVKMVTKKDNSIDAVFSFRMIGVFNENECKMRFGNLKRGGEGRVTVVGVNDWLKQIGIGKPFSKTKVDTLFVEHFRNYFGIKVVLTRTPNPAFKKN